LSGKKLLTYLQPLISLFEATFVLTALARLPLHQQVFVSLEHARRRRELRVLLPVLSRFSFQSRVCVFCVLCAALFCLPSLAEGLLFFGGSCFELGLLFFWGIK
jgi:hypothetical protein